MMTTEPGHLERPLRALVTLGCVITLLVTALGPRWLWHSYGNYRLPAFWIENTLVGMTAVILATALILRGASLHLRLALALPLAHLAAVVAAWAAYNALAPQVADISEAGSIPRALPMGATTLGALLLALVVGRLTSRRRDWHHGATVFALSALLAVGLWLPIAASWYCRGVDWSMWHALAEQHPYRITGFVVIPPVAAAIGYTLLVMRAPAAARMLRWPLSVALPIIFVAALAARLEPPRLAFEMYGNFVHILLAQTIAVIATFAVLAIGLLARARRAKSMLASARRGTVRCDGLPLALELTSWLRGPRYITEAFTVHTPREELIVPAGIEILAPMPPETTQLRIGEALPLLRAGDPVLVGGFVDADPSHPFRGSLSSLPGDRGLAVAHAERTSFGDADLALVLWRPALAYLMIAVSIALPALAAVLAV
ncbi:MAG: hypothetical protein JO257_17140 [Deltaproteobacteria bacterium]|nr:hypothetical protein [Deltaproteobacteria bacterium]